jgi:hypothetical protein
MPRLLSGSTLRRGGSGEFIDLKGAMPQLPPTETIDTGFTIVTDSLLRTTYRSSLGFIEFNTASMRSALPEGVIRVLQTGSTYYSTSTQSATLVVEGSLGVGLNMHVGKDLVVNKLQIGAGWNIENEFQGWNNIVFKGTATTPGNDFNNGQQVIAIGHGTVDGLETANKVIAIGRYAVSSGTDINNIIAIGDSALKEIGVLHEQFIGNITSATNTNPVIIEVIGHNVVTGTHVLIENVVGMTELNNNDYWVDAVNNNELALYTNNILSTSLNGTGFSSYVSGGTVGKILQRNNNIAIGNSAAEKLIDGTKNFFFGDKIAKNLITGSNNLFIGSDVAQNITEGSGIISIASDNLVDKRDNQIAIGSVFYYDGTGTTNINANAEIGIGTQSTGTTSGGLRVIGGAAVQRNLFVGEEFNVFGTSTFYKNLIPGNSTVNLGTANNPFNSLYLIGSTLYLGTVTLKSYNSTDFTIESPSGYVTQTVGNLFLNSGVISTTSNNGSLVVTGGVGISGGLNVGGTSDVDISPSGATVTIKPSAGGTVDIRPNATGNIDNIVIGANDPDSAYFTSLESGTVNVTSSATSTSTTTGALTVAGGVGIRGDVYSRTGHPDENLLLYTPKSEVSTTAPLNPRIGDFWIDPTGPYVLQYVKDGSNRIWVQIT